MLADGCRKALSNNHLGPLPLLHRSKIPGPFSIDVRASKRIKRKKLSGFKVTSGRSFEGNETRANPYVNF
jgi:hypothetical protein